MPRDRANEWAKLLAGFDSKEPAEKRRARVAGLARACKLFAKTPKKEAPKWDSPVRVIAGVGPKTTEALSAIGVTRAGELPWPLPIAFQDLRSPTPLAELLAKEPLPDRAVITATVKSASVMFVRGRRGVRLTLEDGNAKIACFYFFLAHGILALAKAGERVIASGRISRGARGALSMVHPDLFRDEPAARRLLPKYAVPGVKSGVLRQATQAAVRAFHGANDASVDHDGRDRRDAREIALPDPAPSDIAMLRAMPTRAVVCESLARVHGVSESAPNEGDVRAVRDRLAWVEAFTRVWARLRENETPRLCEQAIAREEPRVRRAPRKRSSASRGRRARKSRHRDRA